MVPHSSCQATLFFSLDNVPAECAIYPQYMSQTANWHNVMLLARPLLKTKYSYLLQITNRLLCWQAVLGIAGVSKAGCAYDEWTSSGSTGWLISAV